MALPRFQIYPPEGEQLETETLETALRMHPTAFVLPPKLFAGAPVPPKVVYAVCGSTREKLTIERWYAEAKSLDRFTEQFVCIEVFEDSVSAWTLVTREPLDQAAFVLVAYIRTHRCRIFTEEGEQTDPYAREPEKLFE